MQLLYWPAHVLAYFLKAFIEAASVLCSVWRGYNPEEEDADSDFGSDSP